MSPSPIDFIRRLFGSGASTGSPDPTEMSGLRLPPGAEQLRIDRTDVLSGYLPLGLVIFRDHQLGNGDYFGFYWPVGRENGEPIVAETDHDGGTLEPGFSSLAAFLRKTKDIDREDWLELPTLDEDPCSPLNCYCKARELIAANAFDNAIVHLEKAVDALPEYTDALAALAGQYLRARRTDEACRLAIRMLISPPSFGYGGGVANIARWFSWLETGSEDVLDDPIWKGRAALAFIPSGGNKDAQSYPVLREAMDVYARRGQIIQAMTLMQTYSDFMNGETKSFQERHGYDFAAHRAQQRELSRQLPHGPRYLV